MILMLTSRASTSPRNKLKLLQIFLTAWKRIRRNSMTKNLINPDIVAQKWWKEKVISYPHTVVMLNGSKYTPHHITDDFGPRFNFIATGMLGGKRIWGFTSREDRERFIGYVEKKLIGEKSP